MCPDDDSTINCCKHAPLPSSRPGSPTHPHTCLVEQNLDRELSRVGKNLPQKRRMAFRMRIQLGLAQRGSHICHKQPFSKVSELSLSPAVHTQNYAVRMHEAHSNNWEKREGTAQWHVHPSAANCRRSTTRLHQQSHRLLPQPHTPPLRGVCHTHSRRRAARSRHDTSSGCQQAFATDNRTRALRQRH